MKKPQEIQISWVIPIYQDEKNIELIVQRSLLFLNKLEKPFEIILVNDASTDQTGDLAENLRKNHSEIRVIHHPENRGYGATLRTGFQNIRATQYVGYTDGDAQYDPLEFYPACKHLMAQTSSSGSKALIGFKRFRADGFSRQIQSRVYHILIKLFFRLKVKDINCSVKFLPSWALQSLELKSHGAFIDAEILIKLKKLDVPFDQIPVTHYARGELARTLKNKESSFSFKKGFGAKPSIIGQTLWEFGKFYIRKH